MLLCELWFDFCERIETEMPISNNLVRVAATSLPFSVKFESFAHSYVHFSLSFPVEFGFSRKLSEGRNITLGVCREIEFEVFEVESETVSRVESDVDEL